MIDDQNSPGTLAQTVVIDGGEKCFQEADQKGRNR
jgi:hypothetical protein